MSKQVISTATKEIIYDAATLNTDVYAELMHRTLEYVERASIGKNFPLAMVLSQEGKPDGLDAIRKGVNGIKIPSNSDWEKMDVTSFAKACTESPHLAFGRFKCRIKQRSNPQVFSFKLDSLGDESPQKGHICCTLLLEDIDGFTIQSTPVFLPDLVKSFLNRRNPRTVWDVLGQTVTIDSRILLVVLAATPRDCFQEPNYSVVNAENVRFDILKHYAGKKDIKIRSVKPEIETRFGEEISYHMIWRALCDLSETRRKGRFGASFEIPSADNDELGLDMLHNRIVEISKNSVAEDPKKELSDKQIPNNK